ncbi:MAG: hypothetical protein ACW976_04480, partial [Candidatus Ranarchaeia archaeon]
MALEKYRGVLIAAPISLAYKYFFFPAGYQQLVDWLGPIVGAWTKPLLMTAIAFVSNPLLDMWVLLSWVLPAALGAFLGGGDWKRGTAIAGSIVSINLTVMALSAAQVFGYVSEFGMASILPPPGFNVALLLTTPLGQSLASIITSFFGGGGTLNLDTIIVEVGQVLGTNVSMNMLIATLTGAICGQIAGSMGISPKHKKDKKPKGQVIETEGAFGATAILRSPFKISARRLKFLTFTLVVVGLMGMSLFARPVIASSSTEVPDLDQSFFDFDSLNLETLQYMILENGDAAAGGIYLPVPLPGLNYSDTMWASTGNITSGDLESFSGLLGMLMLSTSSVLEIAQIITAMVGEDFTGGDTQALGFSMDQLLGLIPEQGIFFVYLNDAEATTKANNIMAFLTTALGVDISGPLTPLSVALPLSEGSESVTVTVIFGSLITEEQVLVEAFLDLLGDDYLNPWTWDT